MRNARSVTKQASQCSGRFAFTTKDIRRERWVNSKDSSPWWRIVLGDTVLAVTIVEVLLFLSAIMSFQKENYFRDSFVLFEMQRSMLHTAVSYCSDAEVYAAFAVVAAVGIAATVSLLNASIRLKKSPDSLVDIDTVDNNRDICGYQEKHSTLRDLMYYQHMSIFLCVFRLYLLLLLIIVLNKAQYVLVAVDLLFYFYISIQSWALDRYNVQSLLPLIESRHWIRAQNSVRLASGIDDDSKQAKRKYLRLRTVQRLLGILFAFTQGALYGTVFSFKMAVSILLAVVFLSVLIYLIFIDAFIPVIKRRGGDAFRYPLIVSNQLVFGLVVSLMPLATYSSSGSEIAWLPWLIAIVSYSILLLAVLIDVCIMAPVARGTKGSYYLGEALIRAHESQVNRRQAGASSRARHIYGYWGIIDRRWVRQVGNPTGFFPLASEVVKPSIPGFPTRIRYHLPDLETFESKRFPGFFIPDVWDYYWVSREKCPEV